MKKEKKEKVNSKEEKEIYVDNELMKKKFNWYRKLATFVEGILLVPLLCFILMAILIAIQVGISGKMNVADENFSQDINVDDNIVTEEISTKDIIINLAEKLSGKEFNMSEGNYKFVITSAILTIIIAFVDYIMMILIIDGLRGIFKDSEINGTPFVKENIKRLTKIDIFVTLLWILGNEIFSMNIIAVIVVAAISYIFKYGYKLQKESDETL